jgi:hypothetical protein
MARNDQKRANTEAKRWATEMRSAEHRMGGPMNNQQGAPLGLEYLLEN